MFCFLVIINHSFSLDSTNHFDCMLEVMYSFRWNSYPEGWKSEKHHNAKMSFA